MALFCLGVPGAYVEGEETPTSNRVSFRYTGLEAPANNENYQSFLLLSEFVQSGLLRIIAESHDLIVWEREAPAPEVHGTNGIGVRTSALSDGEEHTVYAYAVDKSDGRLWALDNHRVTFRACDSYAVVDLKDVSESGYTVSFGHDFGLGEFPYDRFSSDYLRGIGISYEPFENYDNIENYTKYSWGRPEAIELDGYNMSFLSINEPGTTVTIYPFMLLHDGGMIHFTWGHVEDHGSNVEWQKQHLSFTVPDVQQRPAPWNWYESNGSASDEQTYAAYLAVTGNGSVSDFSHLVWNDLVDCTERFMKYIGQSCLLESAKMDELDKTLTADRFNLLRKYINLLPDTYIQDVVSGDPVLGSYFIQIANALQ